MIVRTLYLLRIAIPDPDAKPASVITNKLQNYFCCKSRLALKDLSIGAKLIGSLFCGQIMVGTARSRGYAVSNVVPLRCRTDKISFGSTCPVRER